LTSSTSVVATTGSTDNTPRGPAIDVFNFGGGCCRDYRQHPLGGLSLMSSSSSVMATARTDNTPRGPAIDIFYISGGCYRDY
jgi:hypothetical protein